MTEDPTYREVKEVLFLLIQKKRSAFELEVHKYLRFLGCDPVIVHPSMIEPYYRRKPVDRWKPVEAAIEIARCVIGYDKERQAEVTLRYKVLIQSLNYRSLCQDYQIIPHEMTFRTFGAGSRIASD